MAQWTRRLPTEQKIRGSNPRGGFYLNIYYNMAIYRRKTRRKVAKGKKMKRSMGTRRKHKKGRRTRRGGLKNAPKPSPILQPTAAQRAAHSHGAAGPQAYDNPAMPGSELHGLQTATLSRQQQREHKDLMDKRLRALMQQQQMPPSPT